MPGGVRRLSTSQFKPMEGFHKLETLWRIEYETTAVEPLITKAGDEESQEYVDSIIGKSLQKDLPDFVPILLDNKAVVTGNAVKGVFRHVVSAQLTAANVRVCVQNVKLGEGESPPADRKGQCSPDDPCFVCTWFGTASRQGALYFSFLESVETVENILPSTDSSAIPMLALSDKNMAAAKRAFLYVIPVRKGTKFTGWITGENLSDEILGAIAEVVEMSRHGFIKFGGLKTRGYGAVKLEVKKIEKYKAAPFKLEKEYLGDELGELLTSSRESYRKLITAGEG